MHHLRAPRLRRAAVAASLAAVLLAAPLTGCRGGPVAPPPPSGEEEPAPSAGPDLEAWLGYLTLEEKVGQLLWFGLPGTEITPEGRELLESGAVGGFILFGRQGSDPAVLRRLTAGLQAAATARERATPGLLIALDLEGGIVQRLEPPFTSWPGAMALGATGSEEYAEAVGRAMAAELLAIGVNMNLAPVADVNNNPANPVIGTRSFGEDPERVARLAAAQIRGLQSGGVSAVAKHFPGHGDTAEDSHLALPSVPHSRERLERVELVPFRAAVEAGVDAIMTAHVTFPAVAGEGRPATLSPEVITGLLKEEMGFRGVVITDAMDTMRAITDHYGLEQALVMALQAGADMLLVTESFGSQKTIHGALVRAVQEGQVPMSRIDDAVRRVLALKARRGLLPPLPGEEPPDPDPAAPGPESIGAPAHVELARRIGAEALTLVRDEHLPLSLTPDQQLLVLAPPGASALGESIRAEHPNVREVALPGNPPAELLAAARQAAAAADAIVYAVRDGHQSPAHRALMAELVAAGKPVVVIGLGMPYELTAVPEIGTYIAAYGAGEPNLRGIGPLLFGRAAPQGRLPVSIPGLYPAGHGLPAAGQGR